jgi:signal peptidase
VVEPVINYTGKSMFPTFRKGDILRVEPYRDTEISPGDVIVFKSHINGLLVVHRVVSAGEEGVRTKGDNVLLTDNIVLQANDIIGAVVSVQRGRTRIMISGGFPGRMYALILGTGKRFQILLSNLFRPSYHWLAQRGAFKNLFPRFLPTKVSCFRREDGLDFQLHWGRHLIGRRLPGQDQWYIRPPFRLFVDERSLPVTNSDE